MCDVKDDRRYWEYYEEEVPVEEPEIIEEVHSRPVQVVQQAPQVIQRVVQQAPVQQTILRASPARVQYAPTYTAQAPVLTRPVPVAFTGANPYLVPRQNFVGGSRLLASGVGFAAPV